MALSQSMSEKNRLEVMQGVNRSTAMYITQQAPLITSTGVAEDRVTELSQRAMIINPSLEIYVLDLAGHILSHRMPQERVKLAQVRVAAIQDFLGGRPLPIVGDDPMRPGQAAVFSASPIELDGQTLGYVYAVVGGEVYHALQQEANQATSQTLFFWVALVAVAGAALVGVVLVFLVTRPVGKLSQKMRDYHPGDEVLAEANLAPDNEIDCLKTSFYKMQHTINQQLDAIQQMDQTRRELIANVSHDLRTPLAALQGSLELMILQQTTLTDEQRQAHTKTAFKQSQRLTRLVGDLFELAKLESGSIEPRLEKFSVTELLQDCSHDLAQLANSRGVTLKLAIDDSSIHSMVHADIGLIQRVLENLINNAIQHTPNGGSVILSVEETDSGARVAVADTGIGISSAELPHIFDRFYQCKDTQHSSQIGSGLGLAIVKRILAIHNASIDVQSRLDEGTKFEFELEVA